MGGVIGIIICGGRGGGYGGYIGVGMVIETKK